MQRFKILIGSAIFLIALFGLTISAVNPASLSESENVLTNDQSLNNVFNVKEAGLFKRQQQELNAAVKAYFDKAITSGDIVGAGVSIVRGDSIVLSDGFGKRNIKTNGEVNGRTIFRLGSLSKGFAGILAANLIQEGKLAWEDKVSDYIPEFQLGDLGNTSKISLAHLLSHTSGAPYHSYTNLVEAGLPLTAIAKKFKDVQPISDPGLTYSYQNALFALSGEMMHKATGEEIEKSLEKRFFKPLGMSSATTDYMTLDRAVNVAMPHTKWRSGWRPKKLNDHYYNAIAAGGISASAIDMGRWMRFILGHNPEIMSKSDIADAFKPVIEIKGHSKYYQRWPGHVASYYGFGWRIHKYAEGTTNQEKTIWHHGGSVNNYRNEIAVYPEADIGICVLLNNNSKIARTVIPDLYQIVQEIFRETPANIALNNFPETTLSE